MSETIFLVDADAATLQRMAAALEGLAPLRCVSPEDAPALLARVPSGGEETIVCVGPDPGRAGVSALAQACPGSRRLALTAGTGLAHVQELLHGGGVSRVFAWPAELEQLRGAVGEVLAEHGRARRRAEVLQAFQAVLRTRRSMAEIADATARALFGVLEGRPVLVQLWDEGGLVADGVRVAETPDLHWVESGRGGEMSSRLHNRPLRDGERSIGEIVVDLGEGRADGAPALELIERVCVLAELAAGACIRQRETDRSVHGTMLALGGLAGSREHGSGRHVHRLAEYVRMLALGLREDGHFPAELSDEGIDDLVRAVPLHDIGKLAIPDAILLKPDGLSREEWGVVQTHAEVGAEVLGQALGVGTAPRFLRLAREAARDHHEKWDGSGYPRGLVGEHIPLVARLLAIAGVYDAVTTHRPYRAARSHEKALGLLSQLAGSHLDPRLVESFLARGEQADAIRERLRDERQEQREDWART